MECRCGNDKCEGTSIPFVEGVKTCIFSSMEEVGHCKWIGKAKSAGVVEENEMKCRSVKRWELQASAGCCGCIVESRGVCLILNDRIPNNNLGFDSVGEIPDWCPVRTQDVLLTIARPASTAKDDVS